MPLSSGTRLAQYEIRSAIGEGGMGEVYLALDTKLDRTVALKVLSPEQARGRKVDSRTDIWSLGVVMYQMVTGRLPFGGTSMPDLLDRISRAQPKPVSNFNDDAHPELERVIRKCLEKERGRRYQSAGDLLVDLKNLKRDVESGLVRGQRRTKRRAVTSVAVLPLVNVGADPDAEYLSDGITESIIDTLSHLPKLRVMARSTVFRYKGREVDAQEVGRELNVQAVLVGRVRQQGGRLVIRAELVDVADGSRLWGEQYNREASDIFDVQEDIAREISKGLRLKLSGEQSRRMSKRHTDNAGAYTLYLKGLYHNGKWTGEGWHKAVEYFKRAVELNPNYPDAHRLNGYHLIHMCRFEEAVAEMSRAVELDPLSLEAMTSLGDAYYYARQYDAAVEQLNRALEMEPNYGGAHLFLARALEQQGKYDEAVAEFRRARELTIEAPSLCGLGRSYAALGRESEARGARRVGGALRTPLRRPDLPRARPPRPRRARHGVLAPRTRLRRPLRVDGASKSRADVRPASPRPALRGTARPRRARLNGYRGAKRRPAANK